MKCRFYQFFVITAVVILVIGCAAPAMKTENIKTFTVHKQMTLDELGPFDFERRMYIYETMDELASNLWRSPERKIVKEARTKTFEEFPIFVLINRDFDDRADEFAYLPGKGKHTREFGFVFDLNKDGKIDYIVFNGGPMVTKDLKPIWMNYHWIDSNDDGKVDIYVYNSIDLDGDKWLDGDISGWVYDTDFDGAADKAEYLGENFIKPVEQREGFFIIKTMFGEKKWGEESDFEKDLLNLILSDINSMMP